MRTGLVPIRRGTVGLATAAEAAVPIPLLLPVPAPRSGVLRRGTEDVGAERTCLHRGATASGETKCPGEGPASLRCAQALRGGVQRGPPAGEPPPRIRDQGPGADDDTQQIAGRSAFPAPHTGAYRFRRFGHPAL